MHDLEITWPGGQARFSPDDSPVTVGRSPDAAVILTDPSVSRRHIEFVWNGTAWTASDFSTHGSFDPIGVRLAPNWTVGTDTTVRLGGVEGVELRIELLTTPPPGIHDPLVAPPPHVEVEAPPRPPSLEDFVVPGAAPGGVRSTPILAPDPVPAPSLLNAPPPVAAGFGAPPPPPAPVGFDAGPPPAPPSAFDAGPPPAPPTGFDAPPAPSAFDAGPPPAPPSAFDAGPPPAPIGFDAGPPPAPPSAFDAGPPPAPPIGFDAPATPSAFDAAPPPAAPSAFDAPPPPARPAGFDPPAPPAGFDAPAPPPPAAYHAPAWDNPDPGTGRNETPPPAPAWDGGGDDGSAWSPAPTSVHHLASTTQVGESTISLSIDNRDFTFLPGTEITVGRDPSCLVAVDERHSLVSRRHLTITHHDGGWWIQDTSTKGTYVDGRKITGPTLAEGAFLAQLGDDDAGVALRIITAGEHRVRRQRNVPLLVAIAVLAAVAIGALALALQNRSDGESLDAAAFGTGPVATAAPGTDAAAVLAQAKQSTVMLLADQGLGSGFFVSDKLIVTNQHVAALAPTLLVAVSRDVDKPAQIEYEARTVALHPFLDIAVLEITGDADGNPIDSVGLPPVKLGDSNTLTLGDPVFNTGFPAEFAVISLNDMGQLRLPPVSATRGEAASWAIWPGCSNPDQASFIPEGSPPGVGCSPDGDIVNAVVITTFASGQGASGSPVFHNDEVVAVVFAGPADEANAGRNISSTAFAPWLEQTIADNS